MFEVGFTEILLIFGIALLVLGPEKLPKLAADVGRWAGRARTMARQLRTQLEQETQFNPLAGIDTDLGSGASPGYTPHSIHTPAAPTPAAIADDGSRAAPAQLADQAPPAASSSKAAGVDAAATGDDSPPDATARAAQDGR